MKKLLTILVLFSMMGFKTQTAKADDLSSINKLSSIESDIAILKSNLDALTKTVDKLKVYINNLTPLTKTIEGLKCSIGYISKDCSDIKKTIDNVQMRVLRILS